jgi:hypothetical protein
MSPVRGQLTARAVLEQYVDIRTALLRYFSVPNLSPERFAALTQSEVSRQLHERLIELELSQSLLLLTAIEALFRTDFNKRCEGRKRETLAKEFRALRKARGDKIRLDEDILETWKSSGAMSGRNVSEIRVAFKHRHWLAHGRYWTLKAGKDIEFSQILAIAIALETTLEQL